MGETYSIDDGYGYTDEPSASHHDPHATHRLVRNRPCYFAGWRQQLGPSSKVQEECGREPSPSWTDLSGKLFHKFPKWSHLVCILMNWAEWPNEVATGQNVRPSAQEVESESESDRRDPFEEAP